MKFVFSENYVGPCWCGSKEQYKNCHLNRHKREPLNLEEKINGVKSQYKSVKKCFHPEADKKTCRLPIIQAHTIQRSGGLSKIAESGKVMDFTAPAADVMKTGRTNAHLIGIKDASTFTGFCQRHDDETFKLVETQPIQHDTSHYFLLAYRAICKELFERIVGVEIIPFLHKLDYGKPKDHQYALQAHVKRYEAWNTYRYDCTLLQKQKYDKALVAHDTSSLNYYVLRLSQVPDILCSSAICPRFDFDGNVLQPTKRGSSFDLLTCSAVPAEGGGAIIFSWLGQSKACERFIRSLNKYKDEDIAQAIIRLAFYSFQNMYGNPSWWKGLDSSVQQSLLDRRSIGMSPEHSWQPFYSDDGVSSALWNVEARDSNILLG